MVHNEIELIISKLKWLGGARGVMNTATRVQILDFISRSTNTRGKGNILPPAMGK